jgi:hypothetical protein
VATGGSGVDRLSSKGPGGVGRIVIRADVDTWRGLIFVRGSENGWRIDTYGSIDHRWWSSSGVPGTALVYAIGSNGGSWWYRDVNRRHKETDQDRDMDEVQGARAILEALIDQAL